MPATNPTKRTDNDAQTIEALLTHLQRIEYIVDAAVIDDPEDPNQQVSVVELLERFERTSNRGRRKQGATVRLFLILMLLCCRFHTKTLQIRAMHQLAVGNLPRDLQWRLGIITLDGQGKARMLSEKQLNTIAQNLNANLDPQSADSEEAREYRRRNLAAIRDALITATHVVPRQGTSYAVDETGVWSWSLSQRKPTYKAEAEIIDEDEADLATTTDCEGHDQDQESAFVASDERCSNVRREAKQCNFAAWGSKTHKNGGSSSFYGYGLHALVRVPDVIKRGGKAIADPHLEPLLVEQIALTPASTDIVDPTLDMIHRTLGRGLVIGDLIGDRHYSYKKYERWALPLAKLGIRQVLDMRARDHGPKDYKGAVILDGTPHCPMTPQGLRGLERPGLTASREEIDAYEQLITEREQYAMRRKKTAQQDRDGKTRWLCPAAAGKIGCSILPGSVAAAREAGIPVVRPPADHESVFCEPKPPVVQIPAHVIMKYQQAEYYGSRPWLISFNRRTYVESIFGNLKNLSTRSIKRGFTRFIGEPLMTLALVAQVVDYNLKELEDWHARASAEPREYAAATAYSSHPLHTARTEHTFGFQMLTHEQQIQLDQQHGAPVAA
ncbi:hypothetical protein [Janibacter indicus]|uniref:Transposase DDE domain-containing protein n=1 Tax=Janibacter indicus TaxID=857417 RepID=A0A1W1YRV8_9MICO|nr:hypothetical protein [Janibacter indicus]SMC38927.1 hypothetical protein SAMN06296429_102314 [Janibacter indicus]